MKTTTVPIEQIRIDGDTQPRFEIDNDLVAEYVEQLENGTEFPPVTVFFDGADHWLADGFHRYHAHQKLNREDIAADVHEGGHREAILFAVGANAEHGQRRTNMDKYKAVVTMLTNKLVAKGDDGHPRSDSEIGRLCKVHPVTVGRIRKELSSTKQKIERKRVVKRGKSVYLQDTSKIGRSSKKRNHGETEGIARDAFKPKRKPRIALRKTALELPHDPEYGARALLGIMGPDYVRELMEWFGKLLEEQKPENQQD